MTKYRIKVGYENFTFDTPEKATVFLAMLWDGADDKTNIELEKVYKDGTVLDDLKAMDEEVAV